MKSLIVAMVLTIQITNAQTSLSVAVDVSKTNKSIPSNFVGFSFDPANITQYFGTSYNSNNSQVVTQQLFNNFYPYQKPDVRFLGNNGMFWRNGSYLAPTSWNVVSGYTCPSCPATVPNISNPLTVTHLNTYSSFLAGLTYKPTTLFGINLAFLDDNRAKDFASTVKTTFSEYPFVFEVGNEPDLYVNNERRTDTYSWQEHINEFNLIKNSISSYGNSAGPVLASINNANANGWSANLSGFIDGASSNLGLTTMHNYPLGCNTNSVSWLTKFQSDNYSTGAVNNPRIGIAASIETSIAKGIPFRMAEVNSICSSGTEGVSDAFGSALWVMDYMFELAKAGSSGINIMTFGASDCYYSPFIYSNSFVTAPDVVRVNPIYYGMLFFSKCVQNNAKLIDLGAVSSTTPNVKVWACIDAANTIRILVINRGTTIADASTSTISISVPGSITSAIRYDLLAQGGSIEGALGKTISSGATFSLAGQTVSSITGALQGTISTTQIASEANTYSFSSQAASASLIEIPSCTAASISTQPTNQSASVGSTASFSVVASGTAPFTYQWLKNNTAISGATNETYTTPALVSTDNSSTYYCVVKNCGGVNSIQSNSATLTITTPCTAVSITTQPTNQSASVGSTASFSVVASGTAPFTYQWFKNNTAISGATNETYTTPALVSTDNSSTYYCVVKNCGGVNSVQSNSATLTITTPCTAVSITTPPTNQSASVGSTASFSVVASGTAPFTYQWFKNNTAISGATNETYTTPTLVSTDNSSIYYCVVKNCGGINSIQSNSATLTITTPEPPITSIPHVVNSNEKITIYPNPFSFSTTVQSNKPLNGAMLILYNSNGKIVKQMKNISGQVVTFYRDNLASGLYFLHITQANKVFAVEKLVITDN